jgi:hypothetical protein
MVQAAEDWRRFDAVASGELVSVATVLEPCPGVVPEFQGLGKNVADRDCSGS